MHGGIRKGAGRKSMDEKKSPTTIYLSNEDRAEIYALPMPNCNSFSQKCRYLIDLGVVHIKENSVVYDNTIRFIDIFSGLGGIRIGFEQALKDFSLQGKCVFSSDIKPAAIRAYQKNFNENSECDITRISPDNLPDFDFLLAGFPCQAFSQAGLGLGFQDARGTLFFDIAKILKVKQPEGFVLENVEGLVSHDSGKTFQIIKNTLTELGYNIQTAVLNGKDFGLAQSRNRIYIVGLKNASPYPLQDFNLTSSLLKDVIEHDAPPVKTEFTSKLLAHYKLDELYGKAIKDKRGGDNNIHSWEIGLKGEVSQDQSRLLDELLKQRRNKKWADMIGIKWMDGMPLTLEMIASFFPHPMLKDLLDDLVTKGYLSFEHPKQLRQNKRVPDISLKRGYNIVTGKLSFEFTKVLSPDEATPTLVATDARRLGVPVNGGIRPLTVNEGLRLFGFPYDYQLDFLKVDEAFDLLGNTVCVPVIKAVSAKLICAFISDRNGCFHRNHADLVTSAN